MSERNDRLMNLCLNRFHLNRFSPQGLTALFRRFGFVEESISARQVLSLKPQTYLSGFAPGIRGWTPFAWLNRSLSRTAYGLLRACRIRNKLFYIGRRLGDGDACHLSLEPETNQ